MLRIQNIDHKTANLSHIFFLINFSIVCLYMRLPDIFSITIFRFFLYFIFLIGFIFGVIYSYKKYKLITYSLLILITFIFLHAFILFYQPSFKSGVSFQNYILQNNITAYFAITQTRLYMLFFVLFIFPSLSFFSDLLYNRLQNIYVKSFFCILVSSSILNSVVAIFQGVFNIHFLAKGSGSSVGANRAPGLLEDSGVAGFYFSLCFVLFLFTFLEKFSKLKSKIFLIFLIAITLFAGCINNSRGFYLSTGISIFIYIALKIYKLYKEKQYKLLGFIASFSILLSGSTLYFINKLEIQGFKRIIYGLTHINLSSNFLFLYNQIDQQRTLQLKIMLRSIKEHFPFGTGLGSFVFNFYQYKKPDELIDFDLPANLYVSVVSELGFVGLLLLLVSFILLINFNRKLNYLPSFTSDSFFIKNIFVKWMIVPLLSYAFISHMLSNATTAFFAAVALSASLALTIEMNAKAQLQISTILNFCSLFLICSCIYLIFTAPTVPNFRWKERNEPQFPQAIGELPHPQGLMDTNRVYFSQIIKNKLSGTDKLYNPVGAQAGKWVAAKTELILLNRETRIYIHHEAKNQHTLLKLKFFNKDKDEIDFNIVLNQSEWVSIKIPDDKKFASCLDNISYNNYCYARIEIAPAWKLTKLSEVGFFIENAFLQYNDMQKKKS